MIQHRFFIVFPIICNDTYTVLPNDTDMALSVFPVNKLFSEWYFEKCDMEKHFWPWYSVWLLHTNASSQSSFYTQTPTGTHRQF